MALTDRADGGSSPGQPPRRTRGTHDRGAANNSIPPRLYRTGADCTRARPSNGRPINLIKCSRKNAVKNAPRTLPTVKRAPPGFRAIKTPCLSDGAITPGIPLCARRDHAKTLANQPEPSSPKKTVLSSLVSKRGKQMSSVFHSDRAIDAGPKRINERSLPSS